MVFPVRRDSPYYHAALAGQGKQEVSRRPIARYQKDRYPVVRDAVCREPVSAHSFPV